MSDPIIRKDTNTKTITVERAFSATRPRVWEAWTRPEFLEKWWAPKPYRAVTKSFDFREGGHWLYAMQGPDGNKEWCWAGYETIDPEKSFTGEDFFCDENGERRSDMPIMHWQVDFFDEGDTTRVISTLTFSKLEDMEKILSMGFEEGFTMALTNLDQVLAF